MGLQTPSVTMESPSVTGGCPPTQPWPEAIFDNTDTAPSGRPCCRPLYALNEICDSDSKGTALPPPPSGTQTHTRFRVLLRALQLGIRCLSCR